MDTIPSSRPAVTTGTWRIRRSVIKRARSVTDWRGLDGHDVHRHDVAYRLVENPGTGSQATHHVALRDDPGDRLIGGRDDHGSDAPRDEQRNKLRHRRLG